jgi:hypothetical protein
VVARENFGPKVAQIAAVALLIDYTVTVAVQTVGGNGRADQRLPGLAARRIARQSDRPHHRRRGAPAPLRQPAGDPRGGQVLRLPHLLLHRSAWGLVVVAGYVKKAMGTLEVHSVHHAGDGRHRPPRLGKLLYGASFIIILRSFANGGSSLTGLEAISNGVGAFRRADGQARPPDPGGHEQRAGVPGARGDPHRPLDPRRPLQLGHTRRSSPRRSLRPRHQPCRPGPVLPGSVRHGADPLHRGQHQLQRLPVPRQLRGRGRLPAPSSSPDAGTAWPSPTASSCSPWWPWR